MRKMFDIQCRRKGNDTLDNEFDTYHTMLVQVQWNKWKQEYRNYMIVSRILKEYR